MYVRRLTIANIRSITRFELRFTSTETAGWHVILGANGSGKSSVIRSLALALAGPKEAAALRQNWSTWQRHEAPESTIQLEVECGASDILQEPDEGQKRSRQNLILSPLNQVFLGLVSNLRHRARGELQNVQFGELTLVGSHLHLVHFGDSRVVTKRLIGFSIQILALHHTFRRLGRTLR